jgi:hypothetical protein
MVRVKHLGWIQNKWSFSENPFSIKELSSQKELDNLFVDREDVLKQLVNGLDSSEGGVVYGISGIRGSGKSTALNKALEEMRRKGSLTLKVSASGTYSEEEYLKKILTALCDQLEDKTFSDNLEKEIIRIKANLLYDEKITKEKTVDASIRASIKASVLNFFGSEVGSEVKESVSDQIEKSLKPYSKVTLVRELLHLLALLKKEAKKIIVSIDETDKCSFETEEKCLDTIKEILLSRDSHFIFVGTLDFYNNFRQVFLGKGEEATTSSIFSDVIPVHHLSPENSVQIINKRLAFYAIDKHYKNPFDENALKCIFEIADGNPKQLMRLCSQGFIFFGDEGKQINAQELINYFMGKNFIDRLSRTERNYFKIVERSKHVTAGSPELVNALKEAKIKAISRQQNRVILERLVKKKFLCKQVKILEGFRRTVYAPTELSKYVFPK